MAKTVQLTRAGLAKLEGELETLRTQGRTDIAEKIRVARGYGDLSENSEYDEAKNEQAKMEARIIELEKMLENDYFAVSVKDKTAKKIDVEKYKNDLSLQGEFVREVYNSAELTDEDKSKIIKIGLKALMGVKIDD